MIKTIYQFGQQLQKMETMKRYFEIFGSPYPERAENEIVIVADIKAKQLIDIIPEKYRKEDNGKYLFRELASSRSTSIVPTLHFYGIPQSDKEPAKSEKELEESIEKFLDKLKRCLDANTAIYEEFLDIQLVLEGLKIELKNYAMKSIKDKKNYLFTLRIDKKWLGDIPEIKAILEDEAYNKYFSSKGVDFKAKNKVCAVTYKPVQEVWGRVDTLGFTVNDIAFSRNGFKDSDSYKMFPVSAEAVKVLEGTKRSLEDVLSFGFQNLKFFVLPHFIALNDDTLEYEVVETYVQKVKKGKTIAYAEAQTKAIVNAENIFDEIIKDEKLYQNSLYYDIFFYEQKQAQFSIKLHVSDVLPSRFKTIIKQKERLERHYDILTRTVTKKEVYHYYLTFTEIKKFFPEPFFFKIVEAIFHKNSFNKNTQKQVLEYFMQIIVAAFKNQNEDSFKFPQSVKRSFCIYQFFQSLQLFGKMDNNVEISTPLSIDTAHFKAADSFLNEHNFFNTKLKKAAFYLGCATQNLLSSQYDDLKSEPFILQLHNLNIGQRELLDIKVRLTRKAGEYKRANKLYDYEEVEGFLLQFDKHFNPEDCDKVELSYAFTVGLTIQKEVISKRIAERKARKEAKTKKNQEQISSTLKS